MNSYGAGSASDRGALDRRELLRGSALLGAGAAAVTLLGGPTPEASASAIAASRPAADPANGVVLFDDPAINFEALFALGGVAYGAGEVGEIIATVNAINARGLSYQSYFDGFLATARRVGQIADEALKAGHRVSARSAYLRSAQYYDQALFFVLGTRTPALEPRVYAWMQRQWNRATQLFDPPFERIAIPYGHSSLPGDFLKAQGAWGKRPTVIINNGSDAENVDVWAFGGAAAIERGYNALIFEGPGQGPTLFERQIPFRPDWERVITPIVDYLHSRRDVDTKRIAMTGWSFTGELVIRAAAFEKRIAAVCADPGSVDTWLAYPAFLRGLFAHGATEAEVNHIWQHEIVPVLSPSERFLFAKRSEVFARQFLLTARAGKVLSNFWDFGRRASRYNNLSVVHKVTAPVLVTSYQLEQFYPGQAQRLFKLLRSSKELVTFTVAEGAEYHDAPMAPQRRNQVIFDWLDRTLGVH
ncbi:MAG: alpha/beta hydrolase [Solirubrobacterales bacterium]|nr:alpha/beta hydrolase [Solirubrobacterales bacterium]